MHKKKKKKYIVFFLCFFFGTLFTGTIILLAKYHIIQSQKGVAVASEMYFTSNFLEHTPTDEFVTKYNTEKWEGDQSLFKIQLRNYKNKLLYNKNVELTCDVTFQLATEPKAGFHYIVYDTKNNTQTELKDVTQIITLNDISIPYGQASEVEIDLGIIKDAEIVTDNVDSDEVMVTATVTGPEYATSLGPLKAKLKASTSNEAFSYESKFKIIDDDNLLAEIKTASGFVYILNTNGGTVKDDVQLRISWNSKLLKFNEFDEIYQTDRINENEDHTICYVNFSPNLNAHREFIFYKTDQFIDSKVTSKADFEKLVKIERIN